MINQLSKTFSIITSRFNIFAKAMTQTEQQIAKIMAQSTQKIINTMTQTKKIIQNKFPKKINRGRSLVHNQQIRQQSSKQKLQRKEMQNLKKEMQRIQKQKQEILQQKQSGIQVSKKLQKMVSGFDFTINDQISAQILIQQSIKIVQETQVLQPEEQQNLQKEFNERKGLLKKLISLFSKIGKSAKYLIMMVCIQKIKKFIKGGWSLINTFFLKIRDEIMRAYKAAIEHMKSWGKSLVEKIKQIFRWFLSKFH